MNTKATLKCGPCTAHGYVGPGLSLSAMINDIHSPEMEISPPKMACGGVIKNIYKN